MAKAIATRELVFDTARQLLAEGIEPSTIGLQQRIGGGSYTTIKRFLDEWQHEQAQQAQERIAVPDAVATKGAELTSALWQMASSLANREVAAIRETAEVQVQASQKALDEALAELARIEAIEAEQEVQIEVQAQRIRDLELQVAGLEREAARVTPLELRLDETKAALITAEQQAKHWKMQAEETAPLKAAVAELQKLNRKGRDSHAGDGV